MLTAKTLRGNWGTLFCPSMQMKAICYEKLNDEIDYLIDARIDGIYSNGTAGEFHNQLEIEFDKVQELLSAKCLASKNAFSNWCSPSISNAIALNRVERSLRLQPSAFQVILPDWVVAGHDEQIVFLQKIAQSAAPIPLVLYNPPHAKSVLLPHEFERLQKEVPSLIGIKVASGNSDWFNLMRKHASNISVFVPGHFLATGVQEGVASGAYSNVACISPRGAQQWWEFMQTDLPAALEIQERILKFFDECIIPFKEAGYSNPALDKFLAAVGGWSQVGTRLRWPYKWIAETEVEVVRAKAKKYLPEFFI